MNEPPKLLEVCGAGLLERLVWRIPSAPGSRKPRRPFPLEQILGSAFRPALPEQPFRAGMLRQEIERRASAFAPVGRNLQDRRTA